MSWQNQWQGKGGKGGKGKANLWGMDPHYLAKLAWQAKGTGKGEAEGGGGGGWQKKQTVKEDFVVHEGVRYLAKVTVYHKWNGFGFVEMAQKGVTPGDKLYVHWKSLESTDRYPTLKHDMDVELSVEKVPDRKTGEYIIRATNVTLPGGGKLSVQEELDAEKKTFVGSQSHRFTGHLKYYNAQWGYGYITMDSAHTFGEEVPQVIRVEQSEMNAVGSNVPSLKDVKVEFGVWKTMKNMYKAYNCTHPGGAPLSQDVIENRTGVDQKEYTGTVVVWNWQQGWGFIKFDGNLPKAAMEKVLAMQKAAQDKGKPAEDLLLYFRAQDVRQGFNVQKEGSVTFSIYTDDKGAGALDLH